MKIYTLLSLLLISGFVLSCTPSNEKNDRPLVVTSTMMLEDAVNVLAGDFVRVEGLMGPGVDPHLYRATPRDIRNLDQAELIIYNGLFLEARLSEVLEKMDDRTFPAAEIITQDKRIEAYDYGGTYDPHVWFDVSLWMEVISGISKKLQDTFPDHAEAIQQNETEYLSELHELHNWVLESIQSIPENRRVLITAHDAFTYFGRVYGMNVMGLQGLSTQSEYGIQDVSKMISFIIDHSIPAIFLETSIAPRSIQSLINGVHERGGNVRLGGELFSDAMGQRGTPEGTYVGMVRHNVTTITRALSEDT